MHNQKNYSLSMQANYIWLFVVLLLVFFTRWPTFQRLAIDSDESTYLLMAKSWLNGATLYHHIWDTKPPGITLLFALFFKIFGISLSVLRMSATFAHGLTIWLILKITQKLNLKLSPLLIILTSLLFMSTKTYSLAANTEIFFITFTLAATYLLIQAQHGWQYILAGLLLGIGFEIKYFVLFDFMALSLLLLLQSSSYSKKRALTLFTFSFLIPFILVLSYFYFSPNWADFYYVTFIIPQKYSGTIHWDSIRQFVWQYARAPGILFATTLIILSYKHYSWYQDKKLLFLLIWFILITIAVIIPKTFFGHYLMQLIPITLLLFFYSINLLQSSLTSRIIRSIITLEFIILFFISRNFYYKYLKTSDPLKQIYAITKQNIATQQPIFIATSGIQIIYHLLQKTVPTKYIHPSLLLQTARAKRMGIPYQQELQRIYKIPNIAVISLNNTPLELDKTLYHEQSFPLRSGILLHIYKRRQNE